MKQMSSGVTAACAFSSAPSTPAPRARNSAEPKVPGGASPSRTTTVRKAGSAALCKAPGGQRASSGQSSPSACRKWRSRNVLSMTSARAPECSSA